MCKVGCFIGFIVYDIDNNLMWVKCGEKRRFNIFCLCMVFYVFVFVFVVVFMVFGLLFWFIFEVNVFRD